HDIPARVAIMSARATTVIEVRALAVFVVLASCGRINFDPSHDGGTTGPRDDARPTDAGIDGPPLACTTANLPCTAGTFVSSCGPTCYAVCMDTVTQAAGAAKCAAWPGTLARIDSPADQTCADFVANDAWLALMQDATASTPSTGWKWPDGTPPTFINWGPPDPDDQDGIEDGAAQCA